MQPSNTWPRKTTRFVAGVQKPIKNPLWGEEFFHLKLIIFPQLFLWKSAFQKQHRIEGMSLLNAYETWCHVMFTTIHRCVCDQKSTKKQLIRPDTVAQEPPIGHKIRRSFFWDSKPQPNHSSFFWADYMYQIIYQSNHPKTLLLWGFFTADPPPRHVKIKQ